MVTLVEHAGDPRAPAAATLLITGAGLIIGLWRPAPILIVAVLGLLQLAIWGFGGCNSKRPPKPAELDELYVDASLPGEDGIMPAGGCGSRLVPGDAN